MVEMINSIPKPMWITPEIEALLFGTPIAAALLWLLLFVALPALLRDLKHFLKMP